MRVPGLRYLRSSARWLRGRLVGRGLILGYHSIGQPLREADSQCVTPRHFAEHLDVLSRVASVIGLGDLVRGLPTGDVPDRAVVLTFDDGYADALQNVKPLLERYNVPATVFVTTGYPGLEFWWDELERIMLSSATVRAQLALETPAGELHRTSGRSAERSGRGTRGDSDQSIYRQLLALSAEERESAMGQLRTRSKGELVDRAPRRALAVDELLQLVAGDLIDIGAHSVTHPMLAGLPTAAQREEVEDSKAHLEGILGRAVTSFSYPNGSLSRETRGIVRESGFDCACASHNDVVWQGSDRFGLPRFWVRDWDGETFSRWLRLWLPK